MRKVAASPTAAFKFRADPDEEPHTASHDGSSALSRQESPSHVLTSRPVTTSSRVRVLVVEDDEFDQLSLRRVIDGEGLPYDLAIVATAAEARRLLATREFDVLVTDYRLPDGSAFDVAKAAHGLPWIIVTGDGDEGVAVAALRAGAQQHRGLRAEVGPRARLSAHARAHRFVLQHRSVPVDDFIMLSAGPKSPGRDDLADVDAELFRRLVDSVTDYAIFLLDRDGNVATWNPGAERLKGYRADEIVGKDFSLFYPAEAIEQQMPARALSSAANEGRFEDEGWRVRKDGSRFWANVVISPVRDRGGEPIGFAKVTAI